MLDQTDALTITLGVLAILVPTLVATLGSSRRFAFATRLRVLGEMARGSEEVESSIDLVSNSKTSGALERPFAVGTVLVVVGAVTALFVTLVLGVSGAITWIAAEAVGVAAGGLEVWFFRRARTGIQDGSLRRPPSARALKIDLTGWALSFVLILYAPFVGVAALALAPSFLVPSLTDPRGAMEFIVLAGLSMLIGWAFLADVGDSRQRLMQEAYLSLLSEHGRPGVQVLVRMSAGHKVRGTVTGIGASLRVVT